MTFEDKAEIVISQLRADRDRLQNAIDNIRAEIDVNREKLKILADDDWYAGKIRGYDCAIEIIDKHTKGVSNAQEL